MDKPNDGLHSLTQHILHNITKHILTQMSCWLKAVLILHHKWLNGYFHFSLQQSLKQYSNAVLSKILWWIESEIKVKYLLSLLISSLHNPCWIKNIKEKFFGGGPMMKVVLCWNFRKQFSNLNVNFVFPQFSKIHLNSTRRPNNNRRDL